MAVATVSEFEVLQIDASYTQTFRLSTNGQIVRFHATPLDPLHTQGYVDMNEEVSNDTHNAHCNDTWLHFANTLFEGTLLIRDRGTIAFRKHNTYPEDRLIHLLNSGILFGFNDANRPSNLNSIFRVVTDLHPLHIQTDSSIVEDKFTLATILNAQIDGNQLSEYLAWANMYSNDFIHCYNNKLKIDASDTRPRAAVQSINEMRRGLRVQLNTMNVILRYADGNSDGNISVYDAIAYCVVRLEQRQSFNDSVHSGPVNEFTYSRWRMSICLCSVVADPVFTNMLNQDVVTVGDIMLHVKRHFDEIGMTVVPVTPDEKASFTDMTLPENFQMLIRESGTPFLNLIFTGEWNSDRSKEWFQAKKLPGLVVEDTDTRFVNATTRAFKDALLSTTMEETRYGQILQDADTNGFYFSEDNGSLTMNIMGLQPISFAFFIFWYRVANDDDGYDYRTFLTHERNIEGTPWHDWTLLDHRLYPVHEVPTHEVPTDVIPSEDKSNVGLLLLLILILLAAGYMLTRKRKA